MPEPHVEERRTLESPISSDDDVDWATLSSRDLARSLGFAPLDANLIAAAVSELAANMLRHAGGGRFEAGPIAGKRGLEAVFRDVGPGIEDTERAFVPGFTTFDDSLGLGLDAARRAVEYLAVSSTPGVGTTVTLRDFLPPPPERFELGIASLPDADYPCNGDAVFHRTRGGDTQLLAVVDGLGQGARAREAALLACEAMARSSSVSPAELGACAHRAVRDAGGERGFVAAVIAADARELRVVTVGDVDCRIHESNRSGRQVHVPERPGLLGTRRDATLREQRIDMADVALPLFAVLASDGVSPSYELGDLHDESSAQDVAEDVFYRHRRPHGDATVAVLRVGS